MVTGDAIFTQKKICNAILKEEGGYLIRKRLHLKARKSNGAFVIEADQRPLLDRLFRKYGIEERDGDPTDAEPASVDFGDVGDVGEGSDFHGQSGDGSVNGLAF